MCQSWWSLLASSLVTNSLKSQQMSAQTSCHIGLGYLRDSLARLRASCPSHPPSSRLLYTFVQNWFLTVLHWSAWSKHPRQSSAQAGEVVAPSGSQHARFLLRYEEFLLHSPSSCHGTVKLSLTAYTHTQADRHTHRDRQTHKQ